jgi:dihydroorotate dehydrogenase electron transfer subunit
MSTQTASHCQEMPLRDHACRVVFNRDCGRALKWLRLQVIATPGADATFECLPGQFVMLDLPDARFWFRRPFSVLTTHPPDLFDIYYKVVGAGTHMMAALGPNDPVQCLGPLGVGFMEPRVPETALYIGGGIGIAPLYFSGKRAQQAGRCFYGIRSHAEIGLADELAAVFGEKLHIATDDGSYGFHGNVCHLLAQREADVRRAKDAFVCGPTRMMQAASTLLYRLNPDIRVYVSLEERMPCGTGACTGCVIPRTDQFLPSKVCVEGPVFDARSILWPGDAPVSCTSADTSDDTSPCEVPICPP